MALYALVDSTGTLIDKCLWDGSSSYTPPAGLTLISLSGVSPEPSAGAKYSGGVWTPAPAPAPLPDLASFSNWLMTSTVPSAAEKTSLVGWLAGLGVSLQNNDTITIVNGWTAIEASGSISSNTLSAIVSAASTYHIPGIS